MSKILFMGCDTPAVEAADRGGHDVHVIQGRGGVSSGLACAPRHIKSITLAKTNSLESALPRMLAEGWLREPFDLIVTNHETNVVTTVLLANALGVRTSVRHDAAPYYRDKVLQKDRLDAASRSWQNFHVGAGGEIGIRARL